MSIARGLNVTFNPINIPLPQIPYELLASRLESAQADYDMFGQLSSVMPQYLKEHAADAAKYKQFVDTISNDVSQAFASGDTGRAMRMLQQGKDALRKQAQAGGLSYALQSAYDADVAAKVQLQETFKKDRELGNNINAQLAEALYKVPELGYNPQTGTFNKPAAPNVPTYFDYNKEMQDWVSKIDPRKYGYVQYGNKFINEVTGEQYDMKQFAARFMEDPRVQQQLQLEGQYQTLNMSPEARQATVAQLNAVQQQSAERLKSSLATLEANLNSPDKSKRMLAQAELAQRGYEIDGKRYGKGDVDGDVGKRTQAALEQLRNEVNGYQPKEITENDLPSIFAQERATGVSAMAELAKPSWEMTKYAGANPYTMEAIKHANKLDAQKQLTEQWAATQQATAMPTSSTAIDLNLMDIAIKQTEEAANASREVLGQTIAKSPTLMNLFGDADTASTYRFALEKNAGNIEAAASEMGVPVEKMQLAHEVFQRPEFTGFSESAMALAESNKSLQQIKATDDEIRQVYIKRNGMKDAEDFVKSKNLSKYGITPEMLMNNPTEAVNKLPQFHKSSTSINSEVPGGTGESLGDRIMNFNASLRGKIAEDVKKNNDAYRTALPTGIKTDSKQFKMLTGSWQSLANNPDEFDGIAWTEVGSNNKYENVTLQGDPDIQIQPAIGKPGFTVVMTGQTTKDDKGRQKLVEKRAYVSDPAQVDWLKKEIAGSLADALNANDVSTALRSISMLEGTDILGERVSPTSEGSTKGTYIRYDNKGNAHSSTGFQFNKVKSFQNVVVKDGKAYEDGEMALITLPSATGEKQWAVVKKVGNTVVEIPDVTGNGKAVYNSYAKANSVFALMKELKQPQYIGTQAARVKYDAVPPPITTNDSDE